jgi:pyruvate dehydrogenase E2 component (dihydrolipoamide acetyltransferase)
MRKEVQLPEISENVQSGTVFSILVAVGDQVEQDQPLIELESEKATVEVPAPFAGTVQEVLVEEGDSADVGQTIMVLETEAAAAKSASEPRTAAQALQAPGRQKPEQQESAQSAPERQTSAQEAPSQPAPERQTSEQEAPSRPAPGGQAPGGGARMPASPAVRRFARELGVDITAVRGSGPHGRVSREDVQAHVKQTLSGAGARAGAGAAGPRSGGAAAGPAGAEPPLPDFSRWGAVERQPFSAIRRVTAQGTARSWQAIPHVTHNDKADITELEEFRRQYKRKAEEQGVKLTLTAMLVKTAAAALQRYPKINASIDTGRQEIVYKKYVHIGVAVDTPRGLLMPVIRDVPGKDILSIAGEIGELADKAKQGRLSPEEMEGGSFAISNLGGIGGTSFTPIVYWPQSAILGVSGATTEPVWQEGQWVPRLQLPLSLSYDHRLIDGADAARFLRWIADALHYPMLIQLEGEAHG